ncbi:MAG: hypothetical protein FJ361_00175 [Gemmatimonadetes bacterium]|nr:hypothetical protein [Gemmatimonadota bacterium]
MSRHLPADHSKGDERTIGGYAAVHARPAAFDGRDGCSYSVELMTDRTGESTRPWGAFLLFVQWKRMGEQGVSGHLESEFLAWGDDREAALTALGVMDVDEVQRRLDTLILARAEAARAAAAWDDEAELA